MAPIKVMIADDHPMIRRGVLSLFDECPKVTITGEAGNGEHLLQLMSLNAPDVVLLDLDMPIMNGQDTLRVIGSKFPAVKVIILSQHYSEDLLRYYQEKGACAYIPKGSVEELLIDAVVSVMQKDCYFKNFGDGILVSSTPDACRLLLTKREIDVIKLFCSGMGLGDIANALGIAVSTADYHMKNIHIKTKIKKAQVLALFAVRNGIISGHNRPFLNTLD